MHNVFHISLLRPALSNGLQAPPPPIIVGEDQEWEVAGIKAHRECRGERQYLVSWTGFDASEDHWVAEAELDNARETAEAYQRANGLA